MGQRAMSRRRESILCHIRSTSDSPGSCSTPRSLTPPGGIASTQRRQPCRLDVMDESRSMIAAPGDARLKLENVTKNLNNAHQKLMVCPVRPVISPIRPPVCS